MTVTDILKAIQAAYPGATTEALKTFVPVFHARLRKHEGDALDAAANEVLGTFRPKFGQPFPIPADFEAHLPSGKLHLPGSDGPTIDFAGHKRRQAEIVAAWEAGQGAKIREARGVYVWTHCWLEAKRLAREAAWPERPSRVVLSAEQIQRCEDQVVSTARITAHGASVLRRGDVTDWQAQTEACRAMVRAGQWPKGMPEPGEASASVKPSQAMQDRLAALARARRQGRPSDQPAPAEATAIIKREPTQ